METMSTKIILTYISHIYKYYSLIITFSEAWCVSKLFDNLKQKQQYFELLDENEIDIHFLSDANDIQSWMMTSLQLKLSLVGGL